MRLDQIVNEATKKSAKPAEKSVGSSYDVLASAFAAPPEPQPAPEPPAPAPNTAPELTVSDQELERAASVQLPPLQPAAPEPTAPPLPNRQPDPAVAAPPPPTQKIEAPAPALQQQPSPRLDVPVRDPEMVSAPAAPDLDAELKAVREDLVSASQARIDPVAKQSRMSPGYLALWACLVLGGVAYLATIALNGKFETANSSDETISAQLAGLQQSIGQLKNQLAKAERSTTTQTSQIDSLKATLLELTKSQNELTARMVSLEAAKPALPQPVANGSKTQEKAPDRIAIQPRPAPAAPPTAVRQATNPQAPVTTVAPAQTPQVIPPAPVARKGPVPERPPVARAPRPTLTPQQRLEQLVRADQTRSGKVSDRVPGAPAVGADPLSEFKITPLPLQQPQVILPR